ncbi:uncharacterized protein LOC123656462 [Melitaea cinxia]|uniref:uncharacterized protein LOC123656462 n=1 Tax=Melitaea cinxia TaxID=113334 RepID=UPI001E27313D|nr:uncharacterized protein LOC123656462 [Melitaea cinxia]
MLDSVSYNIIQVWECYRTTKPFEYKNNHCDQETAIRKFIKYKYYCFNCSHLAVTSIIIPNEDNQNFIEKFINRTVILAHGMYLSQITRKFILETIKDMISWSKHAMQNKINLERNVQNQKSMESSKNNVDKICIFSTGTEDRKLSISIAPELLKKHVNCEIAEDAHKHKQRKESNRDQRIILAENADNFHKKIHSKNLSISTLSEPQENLSNTVLLGNELQTINLLTDDVNDQNPNAISRSSISRDSGFVSPVYRPPSRDPKTSAQDEINTHVAQTLCCGNTESPNDALVIVASCRVCSIKTRRMCVGCAKEYYCSKECQRKDWPRHRTQCR